MAKETDEKKRTKRPTAKKRDLQNKRRRLENRIFKSQVRTAIRRFEEAIKNGDENVVKETLSRVYALMDKGVKKGVFKLNKASRTKSRLAARAVAKG